MKTLISSVASMLLGLIIGWYVGHAHTKPEATAVVEQMLETTESSDAAEAIRDVRAIGLIQSGESQRAVQLLCTPIANYYSFYGSHTDKNEQRSKLRFLIEDLIRTNKIVADAMTNHMANQGTSGKVR